MNTTKGLSLNQAQQIVSEETGRFIFEEGRQARLGIKSAAAAKAAVMHANTEIELKDDRADRMYAAALAIVKMVLQVVAAIAGGGEGGDTAAAEQAATAQTAQAADKGVIDTATDMLRSGELDEALNISVDERTELGDLLDKADLQGIVDEARDSGGKITESIEQRLFDAVKEAKLDSWGFGEPSAGDRIASLFGVAGQIANGTFSVQSIFGQAGELFDSGAPSLGELLRDGKIEEARNYELQPGVKLGDFVSDSHLQRYAKQEMNDALAGKGFELAEKTVDAASDAIKERKKHKKENHEKAADALRTVEDVARQKLANLRRNQDALRDGKTQTKA